MENQGYSLDQVLELLNKVNQAADERMLKAIAEIKKPSPEEQAKLDREHAKARERALSAARLAMAEEQGRDNAAKNCPHGTTHRGTGVMKHQWRAQTCTPYGEKPYYIPRCTQCGSTWDRVFGLPSPKVLANSDQLQSGVNMDQWSMDDIHRMVEWIRRNPFEEPAVVPETVAEVA